MVRIGAVLVIFLYAINGSLDVQREDFDSRETSSIRIGYG